MKIGDRDVGIVGKGTVPGILFSNDAPHRPELSIPVRAGSEIVLVVKNLEWAARRFMGTFECEPIFAWDDTEHLRSEATD